MGDVLVECAVKRKVSMKKLALQGLVIGLMVAVFAFFLLYYRMPALVLIGIILCVISSKVAAMCDEEYEYVFVNGDIDFAKIVGKKKRLELLSVSMNEVELVAPVQSDRLTPYRNTDRQKYQVKDFSSAYPSHTERMYEMICKSDNQAYRITFEPNQKLLEAMWQLAPRVVVKAAEIYK